MFNKGFTLIELMVVLAIIGLLSTIVLVNTQNTRFKAHDANIKQLLHQVRNAAEFSYIHNKETYDFICDPADNSLINTGELGTLEKSIQKENNNQKVACFESADGKDFAAASPLRATQGRYWCVQAAGLNQELNHQITAAICQ